MPNKKVIWLLPFIILLIPIKGYANNPYVYLVKAFDCRFPPQARTLTGFRVRGLKGIVTALHGVADSGRIVVQSKTGVPFNSPLRIAKVDIEHDLALLSSDEVEASEADGFPVAQNINWEVLGIVKVIGHPFGIGGKIETDLSLRRPPLEDLRDLVPATPLLKLIQRRSPNPDLQVVSLAGSLLPGHSGAPILTRDNQLVAVANGGLERGAAQICWAIPWQSINLQNVGSTTRFQQIAQMSPDLLFSVNQDVGPTFKIDDNIPPRFPIKVGQRDSLDKGDMETTLTISSEGRLDSVTTIKSTHDWIGFCGKIAFWLLGKDGKVLDRFGGQQWCVDGKRVPLAGPSERRDELHLNIPTEILNKTYSVAILHTLGSKNPLDLLQENIQRVTRIKRPVEQ